MLFLWIFGNNVEDSMGPVEVRRSSTCSAGVAASACRSPSTPARTSPTSGASGAVAGVLGGYLLLFPRARVITVIFIIFFFTIIELPALLILGFWFVQQVAVRLLRARLGRRGGRRRVLRPHRRVRLRAARDQAVRRRSQAARSARAGALMTRTLVLGVALAFLAVLGFLTLFVLFSSGLDVLVVVSLVVLGLIGFGVIGSFTGPRDGQ